MRGTRWLLLVAILAISAGIGVTYRNRKQVLREEAPAKPVMLIAAQHDLEFGTSVQRAIYSRLKGRRALVQLGGGAGHATFGDQCEGLWASGTLLPGDDVRNAENPGGLLELAQNGCYPDEVEPAVAWPVVTHFTVAFLRSVFGIDLQPVGLGNGIAHAFPKVPLSYVQAP